MTDCCVERYLSRANALGHSGSSNILFADGMGLPITQPKGGGAAMAIAVAM